MAITSVRPNLRLLPKLLLKLPLKLKPLLDILLMEIIRAPVKTSHLIQATEATAQSLSLSPSLLRLLRSTQITVRCPPPPLRFSY